MHTAVARKSLFKPRESKKKKRIKKKIFFKNLYKKIEYKNDNKMFRRKIFMTGHFLFFFFFLHNNHDENEIITLTKIFLDRVGDLFFEVLNLKIEFLRILEFS